MLLLVVLSLLVLFLMIGTAFIITSKQAEKAAKITTATAIAESNAAARGDLLSDVLLQLVRDTDNPNSSLRYHSLLGDMYGNDGFVVIAPGIQNVQWAKPIIVADADPATGIPLAATPGGFGGVTRGQMVQFDVMAGTLRDLYNVPYQMGPGPDNILGTSDDLPTLSSIDGAYNGQVVTFTSAGQRASAKGVSTRIVDYRVVTPGRYQFTVLAFPLEDGSSIGEATGGGPNRLNGSRILVNGRAFSGTGVGYNPLMTAAPPVQPRLNLREGVPGLTAPPELALLPNVPFFDFSQIYGTADGSLPANPELLLTPSQQLYVRSIHDDPTNPARQQEALRLAALVGPPGYGGENEAYDAADFQNYFLALMQDQPGDRINSPGPSLRDMVLPSFHRPELINYWRSRLLGAGLRLEINPMLLRKIMSRPSWFDHPNFTGSNPSLARWHEAFRYALEDALESGGNPLANTLVQDTSRRLLDHTMDPADSDQVVLGPWDVDNDGDGSRDSVWVDFGAPVIMGPNGKLVKPLAAILCLDLDGRVNLNTAGTLDMASPGAKGGVPGVKEGVADGLRADDETWLTNPRNPGLGKRLAGGLPTGRAWNNVPRGIGWGPAEISAAASLGPGSFERLLTGGMSGGQFYPGRYGRDLNPLTGALPFIAVPGRPGFDFLGQTTRFGWPQWGVESRTAFGSQPDLRARYGIGLNDYGQFVNQALFNSERPLVNNNLGVLTSDSPYEATIYSEGTDTDNGLTSIDAPFSVAELERLLRMYDTDATTLPRRLAELIDPRPPGGPTLIENSAERNRITVESWQVPTATIHLPPDLLVLTLPALPGLSALPRRPQTAADLLEIRIRAALNRTDAAMYPLYPAPLAGDPNDPTTPVGHVRRLMRQLLPSELAAGQRLNVNRPFGNGRDDNGNRMVDEPGEDIPGIAMEAAKAHIWQAKPAAAPAPGVGPTTAVATEALDVNFDSAEFTPREVLFEGHDVDPLVYGPRYDALLQRQLMARDLYVAALMTSAPANYGANVANDRRLAERIAQWAVNAVDFRDADATMTGFEYDVYPFDGWHVNGLIGDKLPGPDGALGTGDDEAAPTTDDTQDFRGVVWGAERPELVITETMAWHDRNTTDEADEDPNPGEEPGDSSDPLNEGAVYDDAGNLVAPGEFDQQYRPRGAFFLELYNPWPANPAVSEDIHLLGVDGSVEPNVLADLGVDLAKTDDFSHSSPVWRIAVAPIADPMTDVLRDPDDPVRANRPPNPDRVVYFSGFDPALRRPAGMSDWVHVEGVPNTAVTAFYNDGADAMVAVPPVRPGRYMVVGSGKRMERDGERVYFSPLGQFWNRGAVVDADDRPLLRGVELRPTAIVAPFDPRKSPVRLLENDTARARTASTAMMYMGWMNPAPPTAITNVPIEAPLEVSAAGRLGALEAGVNFPAAVPVPRNLLDARRPVPATNLTSARFITDVAIIDRATRAGEAVERRLTISEPADGYPHSVGNVAFADMEDPRVPPEMYDPYEDGYYASAAGLDAAGRPRPDARRPKPIDTPLDNVDPGAAPGVPNVLEEIGTHANYKQVFLQRLANPLMPFDPVANPYRTVDRATVNLTVFNGRLRELEQENGQSNRIVEGGFSSLERGYRYSSRAARTPQDFNLWGFQPIDDETLLRSDVDANRDFSRNGKHRIGRHLGAPYSLEYLPPMTLGFTNRAFMNDDPGTASNSNRDVEGVEDGNGHLRKRLRPVDPMPFFAWNNRPYVSGNELMLVPFVRSSQLLANFTMEDDSQSPYEGVVNVLATAEGFDPRRPPLLNELPPFLHLENFFYEHDLTVGDRNTQPPRLYRLLELVETPSLYAQAQTWLNPTWFKWSATGMTYDDPRYNRQPPFNTVSTFREPGRINLNTISSPAVYAGLFHDDDDDAGNVEPDGGGSVHPGPRWRTGGGDDPSFVQSRRGYGAGNDDLLQLNPTYPTFFVNPFRPSTMANMAPLANMVQIEGGTPPELHGSECTLFRSQDAAWNQVDDEPLFKAETDGEHCDAERNPFFHYSPMTRLQNLTGTQSNVFAVWITIGFFEVEESNFNQFREVHREFSLTDPQLRNLYDRVYPDGYTFGKEDGLDEGNVRRLRGFYIIDRSRPAAFEPGVDRNVENVIRLQRRIE